MNRSLFFRLCPLAALAVATFAPSVAPAQVRDLGLTPTREARLAPRAVRDNRGKARSPHVVAAPRIPTPEVLIQLRPGGNPTLLANLYGLNVRYVFPGSSRLVLLGAPSVEKATAATQWLRRDGLVQYAVQNRISLNRKRQNAAFAPNDPYYVPNNSTLGQWNLNRNPANQGSVAETSQFAIAWGRGWTGQGVTIGIVDDGVETTHEDLAANYSAANSWDFVQNDADPNPVNVEDEHGTVLAGIAAGRGGNGIGITGAAPFANFAGLRVDFGGNATDATFVAATLHRSSGSTVTIPVKNHSYGAYLPFESAQPEFDAITTSAASGTVHVFAAGNDRDTSNEDANKTQVLTNPSTIVVSAMAHTGAFSSYSSFGANITVAAASDSANGPGFVATDRSTEDLGFNGVGDSFPNPQYTTIFGGTSVSAATVSGAAALVEQINPNSNARYFKHLLARASKRIDPTDASSSGGWTQNAAGIWFNPNYGFGLLDADALTVAARKYASVSARETESTGTINVGAAIPDNSTTGVTRTFTLAKTTPLEEVSVNLNVTHPYRGDITAYLTSPSGTTARVVFNASSDANENIDWAFLMNAFWGENPAGTWTLKVADVDALDTGTLNSFSVTTGNGSIVLAPTVYNARYISQEVPTSVTSETNFTGRFTFQNTGSADWVGADGALASEDPADNTRWGTNRIAIPAGTVVRPGDYYTYVGNLRSPASVGTQTMRWRPNSTVIGRFGESTPATNVTVLGGALSAEFVSQSVPTTVSLGQSFNVTITMKNTGTETWTANSVYRLGSQSPESNSTWGRTRIIYTGADVAPGQNAVFTATLTAPTTPGAYNFQWRMVKEGVAWFGAQTALLTVTASGVPLNSDFVSQSVPTSVNAGQTFTATIVMKNTGTETWTAGSTFGLGSQSPQDNRTWGSTRIRGLATNVATGQNGTFTSTLTAPTTPGTYTFQWKTIKEGVAWFGATTPSVTITVSGVPLNSEFVSQSVPTSVAASSNFNVTITMKNTGTETWTANSVYRLGSQNPESNSIWGAGRIIYTGGDVAPGQNAVFTRVMTAPATPGTYNFQWRTLKEGVAWFGATTPNVAISVVTPALNSEFVSQSVPTTVPAGQTFTATIVMKNTGTETWTAGSTFGLGSQSPQDNSVWGSTRIRGLATNVATGQNGTFTQTLRAPTTPGTYTFQWKTIKEGVAWFGDQTQSITITVN